MPDVPCSTDIWMFMDDEHHPRHKTEIFPPEDTQCWLQGLCYTRSDVYLLVSCTYVGHLLVILDHYAVKIFQSLHFTQELPAFLTFYE